MANITAADVQKLRQLTGAGMMDCKHALNESNGDFEKAIEYLRKKGQKIAAKRAERDANEGFVLAAADPDHTYAVNVMVNCETDFVAKNQEFSDFVKYSVERSLLVKPKSLDEFKRMDLAGRTVQENLMDLMGKIGEKLEIAHFEVIEAPMVTAYNHFGNRLATIVGFNKRGEESVREAAHQVAMQVAAMNPVAVDKEDVDPVIVEREMEIGKEQARLEGKPEQMLDKIAQGKLNKFYKDSTLMNQEFIRDNTKTIRQFLESADKELKVTGFKRLMLGA
ncbi:MAG TPA: translation elongation factor Ts [Bacteroidales bacterium]|nr:translation elongation factor Ts [Bacteroidales bacterium]HNS46272.1 translation elongation factor Ts [Bacteroidales bacterium]